jgi:hypothetical protein
MVRRRRQPIPDNQFPEGQSVVWALTRANANKVVWETKESGMKLTDWE